MTAVGAPRQSPEPLGFFLAVDVVARLAGGRERREGGLEPGDVLGLAGPLLALTRQLGAELEVELADRAAAPLLVLPSAPLGKRA